MKFIHFKILKEDQIEKVKLLMDVYIYNPMSVIVVWSSGAVVLLQQHSIVKCSWIGAKGPVAEGELWPSWAQP